MCAHLVRPAATPSLGLAYSLLFCLLFTGWTAYPASTPHGTDDSARLNNLGVAYLNQQLGEQALAHFKDAIAINDSLAVPHLNAGIALLSLQRLNEARVELVRAASLDPSNPRISYNLGLLYRELGSSDESIQEFEHVLKIDPSAADAHYFLGSLYFERKEYPRAIEEYLAALHLNAMHASAEFGLARALQRSGNVDEAREHLKRFEHLTHEKLAPVLARTYGDQGAYSLAEEIKSNLSPVGAMIPLSFTRMPLPASSNESSIHSGAHPELSGGMCVIDMEGRGRPDLIVLNEGANAVTFYHHLPDGGFEPAPGRNLGLGAEGRAVACAVGDFDNDGHPDVALAMSDRLILYRSLGNGHFADVTEKAQLRQLNAPAGLTFVDYDHDGDVDLFVTGSARASDKSGSANVLWRNNGDQTFTEWTTETGLGGQSSTTTAMLSDLNNDRAVDLAVAGQDGVMLYMNPREGHFLPAPLYPKSALPPALGLTILDFNKDGWMDIAVTHAGAPGITLWKNIAGNHFERVALPLRDIKRAWGITSIDVDNDGWIDLAAVVETSHGTEVRVFRNTGTGSFEDVSERLGLGKLKTQGARSIVAVDLDGDGDADLIVSTLDGPPLLLRNDGGNRNHSIQIVLHGNADNKSAIGTKVEVFAGGLWQKWEVAGASGFLTQGATSILAGLGEAKQPDIVRTLWPTGVPQDEINLAAKGSLDLTETDRRGSSCPVLFAWDGTRYQFISDTIGAAVIGHWISPNARNIPDPDEWIKVDGSQLKSQNGYLSLRLGEPMEEVNFVDQVRLLAIDHPADSVVFPNERFKDDPPFPERKTIFSRAGHPPSGAWDNDGKDVLALLRSHDHEYVRDFTNLSYAGFANTHSLTLDLGEWDESKPLRLLMTGFIEYFSASSLYSAWQSGLTPISPYVEAQMADGTWKRVIDDMGFPAGLPRTIITDLTGRIPSKARRIRITTNLQIYWDQILVSNEDDHPELVKETELPIASASLAFRGYPRQVDGKTPGDLTYYYDQASVAGPFARQRGSYTHYGDVTPLVTALDNQFVIFGSGEDIDLEFRDSQLPALPAGWKRDYFFYANGYVKDMDFYEAMPFTVSAMPFHGMSSYPYSSPEHIPDDAGYLEYQLFWNDRFEPSNPQQQFRFDYKPRHAIPDLPPACCTSTTHGADR
ncbi:FG-GAP-like repeat-containing protein [Edaphobacter bradus]|uniref:FG-GAP-like repeat-containing protein n=1 Tax=Edaphobacter bradus TaxID=2259016 RepID=UPI0021E08525|nr:FG-GAP-like repeat-containing protein [Edaphobacter bradus]